MIQIEPCKRCGQILVKLPLGGISIKADPSPLDAQEAVDALLGGRELYRLTTLGGNPYSLKGVGHPVLAALNAEPGERPHVVREHRCPPGAAVAPPKTVVALEVQPCTRGAQNPAGGPSRTPFGLDAPDGRAQDAIQPPSEGVQTPVCGPPGEPVDCHRCRRLQDAPEGILTIRLDELEVWADHHRRHRD